jgi:hypothetical protein
VAWGKNVAAQEKLQRVEAAAVRALLCQVHALAALRTGHRGGWRGVMMMALRRWRDGALAALHAWGWLAVSADTGAGEDNGIDHDKELTEISLRFHIFAIPLSPPAPVSQQSEWTARLLAGVAEMRVGEPAVFILEPAHID